MAIKATALSVIGHYLWALICVDFDFITYFELTLQKIRIDPFHIIISLSNRSSIEKSIKLFLKMKGQIAF